MLKKKKRAGGFLFAASIAALLAGCGPPGLRALREGQRLMEAGKYDAAVQKLKLAVTLMPTNAPVWNNLGLAYHQTGLATNAVNAYRRALALNPDLVEARYNLGCLFLEQNKLDGAKAELTIFTMRRPKAIEGWLKLGSVQLGARDAVAAEKSFSEVLKISTNNPAGWNGLGLAQLARNHPREAAHCFTTALKQQPDFGPAMLNLAVVAESYLNSRPLALEKYREYASLKPRPPDADAVLASARRLEQELNPASPAAVTSSVGETPNVANAPKSAATNTPPVAVVKSGKNEPATNAAKPPPPIPATAPPAKVEYETVILPEQPVVRPAHDAPVAVGASGSVTASQVASNGSNPSNGSVSAPRVPEAKPEKRGFFASLNPANWFSKQSKAEPAPTPLPAASTTTRKAEPVSVVAATEPSAIPVATASPTPPESAPQPAPKPAPLLPSASPPPPTKQPAVSSSSSIPRYTYHALPKPVAGRRSEAQRAFAQGLQAQRSNRLAEAMQAYRQAAQLDPSYFEAYYNLGVAAYDSKAYQPALNAYENALAINPESVDARFNFALTLRESGYLLDAAAELERLLAANPNETRAHFALANLYAQRLHQPSAARQHYLKVLELEPQYPQATAIRYWLAANPG